MRTSPAVTPGMYLNVALAYGGQCELVDAAKALARRVKEGKLKAEDLNEDLWRSISTPKTEFPFLKLT